MMLQTAETQTSAGVPAGLSAALRYQDEVLPRVSRTFALTIPQLPEGLREAVANAYLLCRIADTIEDDPAIDPEQTRYFQQQFAALVIGEGSVETFAAELYPLLSQFSSSDEHDLIRNVDKVLQITASFSDAQRQAIARCLRVMCAGMHRFQQTAGPGGLRDQAEMDRYCYFVAGVVGEMLTDLFCAHSPAVAARRPAMAELSVSFGQGLQMVNILKDVWDDRARGACWLPRETFARHGFNLDHLSPGSSDERFKAAYRELIGVAHTHLRNAMEYTLLIPSEEAGIRRFCAWAIGMAVLTLDKINEHLEFASGADVKITRSAVAWTILLTRMGIGSNRWLRWLFDSTARRLPRAPSLQPGWGGFVDGVLAEIGERIRHAVAGSPAMAAAAAGTASFFMPDAAYPEPAVRGGAAARAPAPARPAIGARLDAAIETARDAILAMQAADGHWCFDFEADCTISAEYILMMHFMDEIDAGLQVKLARYIRSRQDLGADQHGGWPQYYGGALDISCTVKCYYALKLAGDDINAPHMVRAREALLARGGAARSNVFTRITLALFGEVPWTAVPYVPVEIMLFPRWAPFTIYKVASWARTVMVPLFVIIALKPRAKNPRGIGIRELFVRPPEQETHWYQNRGAIARLFLALDWIGRRVDRFIPKAVRQKAIKTAEDWFVPRLNGEDGINGIFPAMVNAYEALALLGYAPEHPLRATCLQSIQKLVYHLPDGSAYCQPCVSPTWDTGWAMMALLRAGGGERTQAAVERGVNWLMPRQELELKGDWAEQAPGLKPGGWAFQYQNPYYPDLDDTAMIAGVLYLIERQGGQPRRFGDRLDRAADWLVGLQSDNGGFGAYDANNTHHWINKIPFADHGAMLDPPTEDVTGRVLAGLGVMKRDKDREAIARAVDYLKRTQQPDGCWWGRWGTNYIYGTWSVLAGLALAGEDVQQPYIRKAVQWLKSKQNPDGGWGETCDSYLDPALRGELTVNGQRVSTANSTAWALLGLFAVGEKDDECIRRGIDFLLADQRPAEPGLHLAGLWYHPTYNAPGFPRVFYLKYHGYTAYFPLWALTRYRSLLQRSH